jgi:hypothetical protein
VGEVEGYCAITERTRQQCQCMGGAIYRRVGTEGDGNNMTKDE